MLQILFDFAFECFQFGSNGSNWHSNALNACRMVRVCIRMLQILFERFEFGFECFESFWNVWNLYSNAYFIFECSKSLSKSSNLHLNPLIHIRMVWIYIRLLRIWFEWLYFHLNASNRFRIVRIYIWMLWMPFECFESLFELFKFGFRCFESLSNCLKLHSMFRISFEGLEFAFECFEFRLNG